jgi:AcrR family transcriptional regulator
VDRPVGLRARKEAEVKSAFFRAAMELFKEQGVDGTSVEEIARKAGYSRATFFNHFGSKKGIFRHFGQSLLDEVDRFLEEADPNVTALERIRTILISLAREADAGREDLEIIFLHSISDPEYLLNPTPARRRLAHSVVALVSQAQEAGQARPDIPPQEMAYHLLSLYNSAVFAMVSGHGDAERTMESAWRLFLHGVSGGDRMAD